MGRPSTYSAETAERILSQLPLKSLREICMSEDMPDEATVYRWKRAHPEFREQYAQAREDRAESHESDLDDIEREVRSGALDPSAARIIADNKKWIMARMNPRGYGDRIQHANDPVDPMPTMKVEDVVSGLDAILRRAAKKAEK